MIDFREHREAIRAEVARQDKDDRNWKWRVEKVNRFEIQLRWEYLEYLEELQQTFAIKYDTEVDAIFAFDHTRTDIIGMYDKRRAGASITEAIQDICHYAHSRY